MRINRPGGLALTREALRACRFDPGDLILDAGCGYGATVHLAGEEMGLGCVGLDADFTRLAGARKPGGKPLSLVAARLPLLPFRPGIFKGIFCECVLSLVPEKQDCLRGFYDLLAPGGRLILADLVLPDLAFPGQDGCPERKHPQHLPATCLDGALAGEDLAAEIGQAGFEILEIADHTRLLKEMACEMVFKHGSLARFWQTLTGSDMTGLHMTGPDIPIGGNRGCGPGKPGYTKFKYMMVTAEKHG